MRLGTLAGNAPIKVLFDAISEELAHIIDIETGETFEDMAGVSRFDPDEMLTCISGYGPRPDWPSPIGSRWSLTDGDSANARVYRTGRPARMENGIPVSGKISGRLADIGAFSSIAAPIFVDDKLWGSATIVSTRPRRLPANTESRLLEFSELVSTTISSAQRREQIERMAEEQAALRRVAMLVASGADPESVWETVVSELGVLCRATRTGIIRYESAGAVGVVALWSSDGAHEELPERWPMIDNSLSARIAQDPIVVRIEGWTGLEGEAGIAVREQAVGTSVMAPVFLGGKLWGGLVVHSPKGDPLADDTERRITDFADVASTTLANAQAREELRRLADEQAAIRRVATLVAQQSPRVSQAVAEELAALPDFEDVRVVRFDAGLATEVVGGCGLLDEVRPPGFVGTRQDDTAIGQVYLHHEVVRFGYEGATGANATLARAAGVQSTIGYPIFVGDRLWGALTAATSQPAHLPERVLQPISDCVDLIATAVHNASAEERLRASRERIVTATDAARRHFERDLHDGAQQRLVALALELRTMNGLASVADELDSILTELRAFSRGLHPVVLTQGGLGPAIRSLARRCPVPVRLNFPDDWPGTDEAAEIAFYYFVAESLTNVTKHAEARQVDIEVTVDADGIRLTVTDDGVGGADTAERSGLLGIADRMEALGGSVEVTSPPGAGTTIVARVPVRSDRGSSH